MADDLEGQCVAVISTAMMAAAPVAWCGESRHSSLNAAGMQWRGKPGLCRGVAAMPPRHAGRLGAGTGPAPACIHASPHGASLQPGCSATPLGGATTQRVHLSQSVVSNPPPPPCTPTARYKT